MSEQNTTLWNAPVATRPLDATVTIPGSKSLSNRFLILAALSHKPVRIEGLLRSRDTELMMNALRALGVQCEEDPAEPTTITVTPPESGTFTGNAEIFCGLAGTVMRFVPPLALFADGPVRFDGDEQAYARPMGPVLEGLRQLGATIEFEGEQGFLPFTITPPNMLGNLKGRPQKVRIDSSASSQFISGLLLIGSRLPDGLILEHTGTQLPSLPHIRMTMEDVNGAGGSIDMPARGQWVVRHADLQLHENTVVEPDLSNAAPFLGAALIAGGTVRVPNWPAHTTQPGGLLPSVLHKFGATVTLNGEEFNEINDCECFPDTFNGMLEVTSDGTIHGLGECDLSAIGEITPSIAAIAVFADEPSELIGIAHLRGHETNRLEALVNEITRVGSHAQEESDGITISPVPREQMHGATLETYADHRMATFAAMLGLGIDGIVVKNVETTRKTIPDFVGMWTNMLEQSNI
ncbi:3-phosphoshikimate 1-carboxyvinyltransferase [Bifidobacterium canis]|uniref:3-phosphoshikimate 1-carboxyvinyltransferase n=1 Tax=Bifidobacterium canis TaxID=2610880 RepID=A0A7K1J303_9BIFI|nr:3-phosphoshikimate 1-carboxyvinyltransferase [Bifidobacterium canis]MUH59033.1 3-phosphoshikimate 1-carboxyvinyltransferase [Bifidobacterium canis]